MNLGIFSDFIVAGSRRSKRWVGSLMWMLALGVWAFVPAVQAAQAPLRPNIIFILADDLGYGDVGCYGQRLIQTPNIDRMAREGLRFTQAYAGSTVCAPSRSVLMTGQHTGHTRVRGNGGATPLAQSLRPDDVTVARVLKEAGYTTALVGKWGLGDAGVQEVGLPRWQGFDYFFGYLSQHHAHNYYPTFLWRNEERVRLRNEVPNEDQHGAGVASVRVDYSSDLMADEALAFLRRVQDRPFFLYYATTLPHANNEARQKGCEVPELGPYAEGDWSEPNKGFAAMVNRLDRDVGRILNTVRELGLERRTLVIFTSDNGPHREGGNDPDFFDSNGPLRGIKRAMYDGGIRVPFIVWWPGVVPAGRVSDEVIWFADFLPTAAALAGARVPAGVDGVDVSRHWLRPSTKVKRTAPLYWEFYEGGFKQALRHKDWKLVNPGAGKPLELYDLRKDVGETNNVAVRYPKVVGELAAWLAVSHQDTPDWPTNAPARRAQAAPASVKP